MNTYGPPLLGRPPAILPDHPDYVHHHHHVHKPIVVIPVHGHKKYPHPLLSHLTKLYRAGKDAGKKTLEHLTKKLHKPHGGGGGYGYRFHLGGGFKKHHALPPPPPPPVKEVHHHHFHKHEHLHHYAPPAGVGGGVGGYDEGGYYRKVDNFHGGQEVS